MSSNIRDAALRLIEDLAQVTREAGVQSAASDVEALRIAIQQPLRVAVAGQIKGGKSTLINALLEEDLLATGPAETTYNVNWLRHGERDACTIRWIDGREDCVIPLSELRTWTARQSAPEAADQVRTIELSSPNAILRRMEIIDTPGFASSHEIDSAKSEAFLALASQEHSSEADAIIYVLKRNMHAGDDDVLRRFRGDSEGRLSPLNAIGVLGHADEHWPTAQDPIAVARTITESMKQREIIRDAFFDVAPVSAKLAMAETVLSADYARAAQQLAALPDERFESLNASSKRFTAESDDDALPPLAQRCALNAALDRYGVHRLRLLCRDMPFTAALRHLREESGVPKLRALLEEHFGARAALIQLALGLHRLRQTAARLAGSAAASERSLAVSYAQRIEKFLMGSLEALGLELLRNIYGKYTDFTEAEIAEARAIAGESQDALPSATTFAARIDYWRARANDARLSSVDSEFSARAMCRLLEARHRGDGP